MSARETVAGEGPGSGVRERGKGPVGEPTVDPAWGYDLRVEGFAGLSPGVGYLVGAFG